MDNAPRQKHFPTGWYRYYSHCVALVVLTLTLMWVGEQAFSGWTGPAASLSNDLYIPSAMLAAGRGFHNAPAHDSSEFSDFLQFRQPALRAESLKSLPALPLDVYQAYHPYLLWTVGAWWRFQGISWDAFKRLSLGFLVLTAWITYGLMTVFLPWWIALPLTLFAMTSPGMLFTVRYLRDFAKAPFILAVLWAALVFVKNGRRGQHALLFAATAGLLIGIGLGFRRDLIVFLPLLAGILFVTPLSRDISLRGQWTLKAFGVLILVLLAGVSGWPVWRAFNASGSLADHDTLMGFATNGDVEMGVLPASYEKIPPLNDLYVSICAIAHDKVNDPATLTEPVFPFVVSLYPDASAKTRLIRHYLACFPWDTLVNRWIAAAWTLAAGGNPHVSPTLARVENLGPLLGCLAVVLLVFHHGTRGVLMGLLLYGFPGYTSLQFSMRHVFQFSYLPWLSAGICVYQAIRWMANRQSVRETSPGTDFSGANKKLVIVLAVGGILLAGAAGALHAWQKYHVQRMASSLRAAIGPEIPYLKDSWDSLTLFIPSGESLPPDRVTAFYGTAPDTLMMTYRVAAFDAGVPPWAVHLVYEDTRGWEGFSVPLRLYLPDWQNNPWYLCFPVYNAQQGKDLVRFAGTGVDKPFETKFLGFREIPFSMIPPEVFTLVMAIPATGSQDGFLATQGISTLFSGDRDHPGWVTCQPRMDIHADLQRVTSLLAEKRYTEAGEIIDTWSRKWPSSLTWHLAAARLALQTDGITSARALLDAYLARYGSASDANLIRAHVQKWLDAPDGAEVPAR
ncbi:MAG TPA: hypothetical protein PK379_08650 [Candidatus Hydrogenedentes bacterium]|nr:tetratricopeptide repeat protein [Candidatus Hydrogenedentota bacterium]HOK90083.1 hypothetical protein [Candidatus Hydrogenedentota bacterium]